jgi:hypothetical protein
MARPLAQLASSAARGIGAALSFAHLSGVSARAASGDEDDGDDKEKDKDAKADGDEPKDEDPNDDSGKGSKGAKGSKAEDDDKKDDDDGEDPKDKGAKGAKADDQDPDAEDEDPDEEVRGKSAAATARRRERARCAAIFGSKHAQGRVALAAHFAFNTTMTRSEAIGALKDAPMAAATRTPNSARQAANPQVSSSAGASPGQKAVVASSWDKAFATVNPPRKSR